MLACETKGSGKPLVLLHAFPLSHKMWDAAAAAVKGQFKVIIPDFPGFGNSPRQSKPSIPAMAVEVAALLNELKIKEPVILCGLSMGGYAAFEFFRQFPERVAALGFFATRATPDSAEARENRFRSIESLEKFGMEPYAKKIVKNQLGKTTVEKHPDVMAAALNIMTANSKEGAIDALRAMAGRSDSSDLLPKIKVPTLVAAGEEDTIVSFTDMEAMSRKIAGAQFHKVAESGHLINLEQAAEFNKILKGFLTKL